LGYWINHRMNCFVVCQSRLWVVTIVFYTCILIPLMHLKRSIMGLFSCETKGVAKDMEFPQTPSLPVARYQDLKGDTETEETCSICLVEYEGEDAVSKLRTCGHVFHFNCIEQWTLRNQFSCPLCRSFLFSPHHHVHLHAQN